MPTKNYIVLRDAVKVTRDHRYGHGQSSVWFVKKDHSPLFLQGFRHLSGQSPNLLHSLSSPDENSIITHSKIGYVDEITPEHILEMMQRSVWCPNGQADHMLKLKHVNHSSMTVGDLIKLKNGKVLMVDSVGFVDLETQKKYVGIRDEHMKFRTLAASLRKVAGPVQESGRATPIRSLLSDLMNEIRVLRSGQSTPGTSQEEFDIVVDVVQDALLLLMKARNDFEGELAPSEQTNQLISLLPRAQAALREIKSL